MKHYCRTGRRNHGRALKRLLDTWDRNRSTSGPTPWQIYDDNDDDMPSTACYYKKGVRATLLIYVLFWVKSLIKTSVLVNDQLEAQFFFFMFISILYMFQATPCSSSGESNVSIQHLVCVTLCRWPSSM
jgi:hypothetical protein